MIASGGGGNRRSVHDGNVGQPEPHVPVSPLELVGEDVSESQDGAPERKNVKPTPTPAGTP